MDLLQVANLMRGETYHAVNDLRYNRKLGFLFSRENWNEFLSAKEKLVESNADWIERLPLKTFNSKHCYYVKGAYLLSAENEYMRIHASDFELNHNWLFDRNLQDMFMSRLFSEVEGSLRIEEIPTTHKRVAEISRAEVVTDKNDVIVKNMLNAVTFITQEKPSFNKENLRKLYEMLSRDCLEEDCRLSPDAYYRDKPIYIGDYEGADWHIVEECMNSMFAFANDEVNLRKHGRLLPYICHYYILYIHPFFDYNGRTARMVSFWLNYINNITIAPYFISEAINESKGDYYRAIVNTRESHNDLTYFLGYILETAIQYSFVYKNLEEIRKELSKTGDSLSSTEWVYIKKILIHNTDNYFNYREFLGYINATMTRQGALKILNNLTEYGILEKTQNRKGDTIYRLHPDCITYQYHS